MRNLTGIWTRRITSIALFLVSLALVLGLFPALLLVCALVDVIGRTSWAAVRCLIFLLVYLCAEVLGVFIAFFIWVFSGRWLGLGKRCFIDWTYMLQRWWGSWLFHGASRIFGIRLEIDEPEGLDQGPLMLFIRHASLPDTSLPGALFILRHNLRLRHIIKKELLWDPVLSIGANRLRHYFVDRSARDTEKELENIRRLTADMGPKDGIMIFPEGTRFSRQKRERIIEKLRKKGDAYFLEKAQALKNILPPRLGGSLAMLEANTKAYAVFCAHFGFEAAAKAINFLNGSLINKTVHIKLWKIPFEEIPTTPEQQIEWLYEHWAKIDEWIELQKKLVQPLKPKPVLN